MQDDVSFIKPKCAVFFDILMKANWENFSFRGPRPDTANGIMWLSEHLAAVDVGKRYTNFFQKAISDGMDEASSRDFASRKLILETEQTTTDPGSQHRSNDDDWIKNIDRVICIALRWKHLVDTIGVPEIALLGYEDGYEFEWVDMPVPDIDSVSNEEYASLLEKLLDPALGFKETCLKLSGVVGMIQRLKDLEESEIGTFLAQEIKRRVKDVLGSPELSDVSEEEDEEDDDESMADESMEDENMADAGINQDVDVAGFDGLKGIDFSRI
ncbi:hypothetical protein N7504_008597 [Penicillium tannophilum]|nr:hypothetical protein N7504_008597 [Penicillium tannophilum]